MVTEKKKSTKTTPRKKKPASLAMRKKAQTAEGWKRTKLKEYRTTGRMIKAA